MVEDTGRDSYLCMFDVPDLPRTSANLTKEEVHEARRVEFKKTFLLTFGEEHAWIPED